MTEKIDLNNGLDIAKFASFDKQMKKATEGSKASFEEKKTEQAAKDFEALLLKQMLDSMWKTVPKDSMLKSKDEDIFRDMYNDSLAKNMSENQELGIAASILKDMKKHK